MKKINEIQELNLKLIENVRYNNCDGEYVARSLRKHKSLWDAVLMTREDSLIMLRDLPDSDWNVDTLFILVPRRNNKLKQLAKEWGADNANWLSRKDVEDMLGQYPCKQHILSVWWD